jgi:hypothetical protein
LPPHGKDEEMSEAKKAQEMTKRIITLTERWQLLGDEIEGVQAELQSLKADKRHWCCCVEIRAVCPFGKKHCPDCQCDACIEERIKYGIE